MRIAQYSNTNKNPLVINMRGDGRLEWVCKHGIGHTVAVPTNWPKPPKDKPDYRFIHGCDYCCYPELDKYPGYAIINDGTVYSKKHRKFLKFQDYDGYKRVQLRDRDNKLKSTSVHRLIAEKYIPNPENKEQVNHKDFNRSNNNVNNLEWVTSRENQIHTYKNGRRPNQSKIAKENGKLECKLTVKQSKEIKNDHKNGITNKDLSKTYNVHRETISRIIRGITYNE